jgi:hypothetical protein
VLLLDDTDVICIRILPSLRQLTVHECRCMWVVLCGEEHNTAWDYLRISDEGTIALAS